MLPEFTQALDAMRGAFEDVERRWGATSYEVGPGTRVQGRYDIYFFEQVWGSTTLGFPGIGGQAMTPAYTVVICDTVNQRNAVYFAGEHAYDVQTCPGLGEALARNWLPAQHEAAEKFGAENVALPATV